MQCLVFYTESFISVSVIFPRHPVYEMFSMWRRMTVLFLSVDDTREWIAMRAFAFDFTTTPRVLFCLGCGGFCFAVCLALFFTWTLCGILSPKLTTGTVLVPIYDKACYVGVGMA